MKVKTEYDALVIDDDPDNCLLLRKLIEYEGGKVRTADDPEEAASLLDRGVPPVLILDLFIPGDGFEFLRDLRKTHRMEGTTVIIYTAQTVNQPEKATREKEYRCRILEKIRDQDLLLRLIRTRINGE